MTAATTALRGLDEKNSISLRRSPVWSVFGRVWATRVGTLQAEERKEDRDGVPPCAALASASRRPSPRDDAPRARVSSSQFLSLSLSLSLSSFDVKGVDA